MHKDKRHSASRRLRKLRALCAVAALLATGACADETDDESSRGESNDDPSALQLASAALVSCEPWSADNQRAFYAYVATSADLAKPNGTLLKCQALEQPSNGRTGYRVIYRTSTVTHTGGTTSEFALPASGLIWLPPAPTANNSDRPVIADTHGAVGVLPQCGPSLTPSFSGYTKTLTTQVPDAVVVAPDYIGLGIDHQQRGPEAGYVFYYPNLQRGLPFSRETHPFLSIDSEGRSTVDIVRAARQLQGAGLGSKPRWFVAGQSQGGHAALAAAQVVKGGYGNDLSLLGVVAGAPGSELDSGDNWSNDIKAPIFAMVASTLPLEWRDLKVSRYLSYNGEYLVDDVTSKLCFTENTLFEVLTKFGTSITLFGGIFDIDPFNDPTSKAILAANSPGRTDIGVPAFVGTVVGDPLVFDVRTDAFVTKARSNTTQPITYCKYNGPVAANTKPDLLRSQNHDAFKQMFAPPESSKLIACTFDTGNNTNSTTSPADFVGTLYRRALGQ